MSDAFDKVLYHGKLMDKKTRAFVQAAEAELDYELTVVQGSYNKGGVSASAGTHDLGGVLDLAAWDKTRKLKVLKDLGAFAWYRPAIPGLWGEHIHFGIRFHGNLAPSARAQQVSFDNGRNGLKSNLHDPSYRAKPSVTFVYPVKKVVVVPKPTQVSRSRDRLVEALHALSAAESNLEFAVQNHRPVRDELGAVRQTQKDVRAILVALPKR